MSLVERIDAHHHVWKYTPAEFGWIDDTMAALRRDFSEADYEAERGLAGIDGSVVVQTRQTLEETRTLLDLAEKQGFLRGVVGWAPIAGEEFPECMEEFDGRDKLKGLRHIIPAERDENYILRADFNSGITAMQGSGLVYDILVRERQLPQTIDFVDEHPKQLFVLDQLAEAPFGGEHFELWAGRMRDLAKRQHVFCKLAGLTTELESIRPYLDVAVESFGPQRLMAGSNWPVCLLGGGFRDWFELLEAYFAGFSEVERAAVFGETASWFYGL
jgi:L-fuconolactonase